MKVNKDVKITDTAIKLHTDLKLAEHLTEGLVVNMIANMNENGLNTDNPEFVKDIGFMIEVVKGTIYRDMGVKHPMQEDLLTFLYFQTMMKLKDYILSSIWI